MKKRTKILFTTVLFVFSMMFAVPAHAESTDNDMIGNAFESTGVEMTDIRDYMKSHVRVQTAANGYPAKYDPRTTGKVTSVKNQGSEGLCWDYAIQAAAESYLIKTGKENSTIDLSELYFLYDSTIVLNNDRASFIKRVPSTSYSNILTGNRNKLHFAYESDYPITDLHDDYTTNPENYKYTLNKVYYLTKYIKSDENIEFVKYMVDQFGGAIYDIPMYDMNGSAYVQQWMKYTYGSTTTDNTFYYQYNSSLTHAMEIVGWDDNYSANNFKETPPGNGAWLLKNSWGTGSSFGTGFMWVSYYNDINKPTVYAMTLTPKGSEPSRINKTYYPEVKDLIDVSDDYADAYYMQDENSTGMTVTTKFTSNSFGKKTKIILDKYKNILGTATFIVRPTDASITMPDDVNEKMTQTQFDYYASSNRNALKASLDGVDVKTSPYITYTSTDPDVVSVDEDGYLTFNGFGTCTINAVYQDDVITNGKAIKGSMSFTFKQLCGAIEIEGDSWSNMNIGDTKTLQVTTEPENVRVSYTSNNPSVATVSSSGVITAVGEGEATITVTDPDEYITTTYQVYVSEPEPDPEPEEPVIPVNPVTPVDPTPVNPTPVTPVTPNIPVTPVSPTTTTQPQQNQKPVSGMFNTPYGKVYLYSDKTAEIVKWTKQNAKATVPTIIVYNNISYTVTDINSGAFKGNKKIAQVIIPSTVTTIGSKAFYGCKKLTKVTVQGKKIDSVGKDAFKKCSKNLVIKVPKSKKKAYKKLFKGYVVK